MNGGPRPVPTRGSLRFAAVRRDRRLRFQSPAQAEDLPVFEARTWYVTGIGLVRRFVYAKTPWTWTGCEGGNKTAPNTTRSASLSHTERCKDTGQNILL